jgi:hypothetical protein
MIFGLFYDLDRTVVAMPSVLRFIHGASHGYMHITSKSITSTPLLSEDKLNDFSYCDSDLIWQRRTSSMNQVGSNEGTPEHGTSSYNDLEPHA